MRRGGTGGGTLLMGEDGGGFGEREKKHRKLQDKLQITFHDSMCVVWVRTGGLRGQWQLRSGLCPRGSQRVVLAYSWVWGKHILKAGTRFFFLLL